MMRTEMFFCWSFPSVRFFHSPEVKGSGRAFRCKSSLPSVAPGFPLQSLSRIQIIALLFVTLSSFAQTKADDIIGNWLTGSKKGVVQIYKEGTTYNGKIIWLREPLNSEGKPKCDKHNPDKAKQTQPVLGMNMLKGFIFENEKWVNGTIYDPENGKTYCGKITKDGDKLNMRGFIGITLIGRTDTWYKVEKK